jgi:hypothetical protein
MSDYRFARQPLPGLRRLPGCVICSKPVPLESSKTNEHGKAIHEECYVLKLQLEQATAQKFTGSRIYLNDIHG